MKIFDNTKKLFKELSKKREQKKYKKYISNFSSPKNNQNRIAKNAIGIIEFDLVDFIGKNDFDGSSIKRFVMVDSSMASEYIQSVCEGTGSYESYLNNEDIKTAMVPSKLSALIKKESEIRKSAEVLSSRVMNFFEIPTVFNFLISDPSNIKFAASLDFVRANEKFYTLFDIDCNFSFNKGSSFDIIESQTRKVLKIFARQHNCHLSKEVEDGFIQNLLYSAMIRRYLLGDNDVRSGNFGLLYNDKTKKIRFCPNFDFGCTFLEHDYCKKNLQHLKNKYPDIYERFFQKLQIFQSVNTQTGNKLFEDFVYSYVDDIKDYERFLLKFDANILNINRAKNEIDFEEKKQIEKL